VTAAPPLPSEVDLLWAATMVGAGSTVVRVRPLTGGITSSVHHLSVVNARGTSIDVVLKTWLEGDRSELADRAEREAGVLVALDGSGLPTPRLLGVSRGDARTSPAILMTRVPGEMCLDPKDPAGWLEHLAETLVRIHSLGLKLPPAPLPTQRDLSVPSWTERPGAWEQAAAVLSESRPTQTTFIHGDYQHFNLLWGRETLTGIVDWTSAGLGHPDRDLGHCRLNLAVLFSPEWADRFRACYEAAAGRQVSRWWDLFEIAKYSERWSRFIPIQVAGRIVVDVDGMNGRVDELLSSALG
jgi:aminoglycoside phosphotransferase (APT) family kinase protein